MKDNFVLMIQRFSKAYRIRKLQSEDVDKIEKLCQGNPLYYEYCPPPVSAAGILEDMQALPPGKTEKDKYYLGCFADERLVAILDLIEAYPDEKTIFIGFFMVEQSQQGQGLGTHLIEAVCQAVKAAGFAKVRLAWVQGNAQAAHFWHKNQFHETEGRVNAKAYRLVTAERIL